MCISIRCGSSRWKRLFCPVISKCLDIGDVKSFPGRGEGRESKWGKRERIEGKSALREKDYRPFRELEIMKRTVRGSQCPKATLGSLPTIYGEGEKSTSKTTLSLPDSADTRIQTLPLQCSF